MGLSLAPQTSFPCLPFPSVAAGQEPSKSLWPEVGPAECPQGSETSLQKGFMMDPGGLETPLLPLCGTLDWSHRGLGLSFPTGQIRGMGLGPDNFSQVKTKLNKNTFSSFETPRTHQAHAQPPGLQHPHQGRAGDGGQGALGNQSPSHFSGEAQEPTAGWVGLGTVTA